MSDDILIPVSELTRPTTPIFRCPEAGCHYYTSCTGNDDRMARRAVVAHLQRKRHRLTRADAVAKVRTLTAAPFHLAFHLETP